MKRFFRIISAVLLISVTLGSVSSCKSIKETVQKIFEKDREYNEAEVISAAKELLSKAQRLNEIYYGKGIEYDPDGYTSGIYTAASAESLGQLAVTSIEDLKRETLDVFSDKWASVMFNSVLSSVNYSEITHYARYYEFKKNGENVIMVNRSYEYYLKGSIEYLDGIYVKDVEGQEIVLSVPVILTSESGKTKKKNIEVRMIEESDGWRFSSGCDAVYNESSDIYEDLENELDGMFPR